MYPHNRKETVYYIEGDIVATRGLHPKYGMVWFIYDGDELIATGKEFREAVSNYLAYRQKELKKKRVLETRVRDEELFNRERLEYDRRLREGFWRPKDWYKKEEKPTYRDLYEKYQQQEKRRREARTEQKEQDKTRTKNRKTEQSAPQVRKEVTPYETLGVSEKASLKSIKKTWRKILTRCHPDKFATKSEHLQKKAEEITKAVNEAYQKILEMKGKK